MAVFQGKGRRGLAERWGMTLLNGATVGAGAFICVAGLYAIIKGIVAAYAMGVGGKPFIC